MKNSIDVGDKFVKKVLRQLKLHDVFDCKVSNLSVEPVRAGDINYAFRVHAPNTTILLKLFDTDSRLPLDRVGVFKLQEELAIVGLAPRPIFLSKDKMVYCEEWVETNRSTVDIIEQNANKQSANEKSAIIELLAESLHNIHSSFISAPILPLLEHWQFYWEQINVKSALLCEQYKKMQDKWLDYVAEHESEFVLCHNDLHLNHIAGEHGPYYDWEYAARGCRYFDLVNCAAINQLDHYALYELCSHYAHLFDIELTTVLNRVEKIKNVAQFTNKLWEKSIR